MKKIFLVSVLFLSLFLPHSLVFADDGWIKLGRGLGNVFFGVFEIVNQPAQMAKTQRWPIALFGGVPKGIVYAIARTGVGIYEVFTFPFPIPSGYKTIMEPDFIVPSY